MTPRDFALTRWCRWCGSPVTCVGAHDANGDFDPYSVPVSDAEISEAILRQRSPSAIAHPKTYDFKLRIKVARFNIAFGKHIGVYKLPDAGGLAQLQRKSIRTVVALAEVVRGGNYDTSATPFDEHHRALKRVAS